MQKARISIVAAIGEVGRAIGKNNELLWRIPEDMKRFRSLTLGHPVIMGRKTFESILKHLGGGLSGRTNIVVSRNKSYTAEEGVLVCGSLEEALEKACAIDGVEIFIVGGSDVYAQALPKTDRLYLTLVENEKEADSFFPDYSEFARELSCEEHEYKGTKYRWVTLER